MRFFLLVFAFVVIGTARSIAGDDLTACNDEKANEPANIAACDNLISSGKFSGPELKSLYVSRARRFSAHREAERAFADYNQALLIDPKNIDLLDRAFISSLAAGDIDEAVKLAERILTQDKASPIARLVAGVRDLKQKKYATAQININQSIRGPITDLVATLLLGWASYGAGDTKAAVANIDKLTGPEWYRIFKDLHSGMILELAGKDKDAGVRLERAYKLDDSMLRVADDYARWLSRNKDVATASAIYETFDKKLPRHPLVLEGLRDTKAGKKLPPLVDSAQAGAAEALYGIGATLTRRGGEDLALVYLQLSLYLVPNHPLALLSLADLYEFVKKPSMAIKVFERMPTSSPLKRNAQIQLATNLDAADRSEEAIKILKGFTTESPKDIEAIMALGNIERGRKKFADCANTYSLAIDALPSGDKNSWMTYYYRGICEERSKQWNRAEADLRKALELQPEQPYVLNYLGYSWIDQGINLDEGMKMIKRAVDQRPDDGYIVDSLGWAYYRIGNYEEAVKSLERAIDLKPERPTINDHLGDAYWRTGRTREAKLRWTQALSLKPDPEELPKIEAKIENGLPDQTGAPPAAELAGPSGTRMGAPAKKMDVPAGPRVALVIGNSSYRNVSALRNPINDANDVSEALRRLGFDVKTLIDASFDEMRRALIGFGQQANGAELAIIFFAGHGVEMGGENWLIPIDAELATDLAVANEAIGLQSVTRAVSNTTKLGLIILDACRSNPFLPTMQRTNLTKAVERGFARIEPTSDNVLVAYAARDGTTAADGSTRNSPFTTSLLKNIETPGLEVAFLFRNVRDDVMATTSRQQQPYIYGSLSKDLVYLVVR